jgi:hypothetical protein
MPEPDRSRPQRRRAVRPGNERPYIDPTPDDEPDPSEKPPSDDQHDDWMRRQKPPHHG